MQKPKKIENLYWMLAVDIAELLNEFKLNLANKVPKKLLERMFLFKIIQYLHECGNELIHLRGDWFKIPELDYVFSMRTHYDYADSLKLYFKEKKRIHFFNRNGRIYAKVQDFVFLLPFPYGIFELADVFYDNCYAGFDLSNGTVVDVGAFIGDTPIYFAGKGAKDVIAYEPIPHLYKIATTNILINNFDSVIRINNEAIGDRYGEMVIYETQNPDSSSIIPYLSQGKRVVRSYKVKVTPLSDVIFNSGQVDLLKLDCQGCEHIALKHAYKKKALKNVYHIIAEVHYNSSYILNLLQKAHFKIETVEDLGENWPVLVYASKK